MEDAKTRLVAGRPHYENEREMKMKCTKCVKGVIMKQIAIADYDMEPCECVIDEWFRGLKK